MTSLDRTPKNKKALQKVFGDKLPKVLGCAPSDHKDIAAFKEQLIAISDQHDDLHVRHSLLFLPMLAEVVLSRTLLSAGIDWSWSELHDVG